MFVHCRVKRAVFAGEFVLFLGFRLAPVKKKRKEKKGATMWNVCTSWKKLVFLWCFLCFLEKCGLEIVFFFSFLTDQIFLSPQGTVDTNCYGPFCPIEVQRESQALHPTVSQVHLLFPYLRLHTRNKCWRRRWGEAVVNIFRL